MEYERFVEERLKKDLQLCMDQRNKIFEEIKIYSDLAKSILMLRENNLTRLRTMVNLGSEVFVQADVPDTSHIFVDVGLGFHVEFSQLEALDFIVKKEEHLQKQANQHTEKISDIKSQIKLVVEGIREMMGLHGEKTKSGSLFNNNW